jgi:hypothetical protein
MRASSLILICILSGLLTESAAQISRESELFVILKVKDSLLFNAAFDTCDPGVLEQLFTEDFEFFHDKGGVTYGRDAFLAPLRETCKTRVATAPQPSKRILLNDSLKVYPLYRDGVLYGAIQEGVHRFEFLDAEQEYQRGDIAKFTHLWLKVGDDWKVKRELSFDHQPSEPSHRSSSN